MTDIETLLAIEAIKKAKATYWLAVDTKNWNLLASTFTADAIADFRGARDMALDPDLGSTKAACAAGHPGVRKGRENIVGSIRSAGGGWITVHHGHPPIIDITSPQTTLAIWPFFDYIDDGTHALKGYGHYHDTYRRDGKRWAIDTLIITRIRADGVAPALSTS